MFARSARVPVINELVTRNRLFNYNPNTCRMSELSLRFLFESIHHFMCNTADDIYKSRYVKLTYSRRGL